MRIYDYNAGDIAIIFEAKALAVFPGSGELSGGIPVVAVLK